MLIGGVSEGQVADSSPMYNALVASFPDLDILENSQPNAYRIHGCPALSSLHDR